mgnify:FL=1
MASELTVQTIKGPTSGGNANKIIIPTGQALEVTDNIRYEDMPVGSILQVINDSTATYTSTNSTSYVATNLSCQITPKFANSKIHLNVNGSVWFGTANAAGNYVIATIYRNGSNIGPGSAPYNSMMFYGAHGTSYESWDRMVGFQHVDSPNSTSQVTYQVYMRSYNNNHDARLFEGITSNTITAMEIKQ